MKPKKPDRFERMVSKRPCGYNHEAVIAILRKEHAWMRRMIKKQYKYDAPPGSVNFGYNQAVEFFLEQLSQAEKVR